MSYKKTTSLKITATILSFHCDIANTKKGDSPNLSTVVSARHESSSASGTLRSPPNMVTSVTLGERLRAVALCAHLGCRLGTLTCKNQHNQVLNLSNQDSPMFRLRHTLTNSILLVATCGTSPIRSRSAHCSLFSHHNEHPFNHYFDTHVIMC